MCSLALRQSQVVECNEEGEHGTSPPARLTRMAACAEASRPAKPTITSPGGGAGVGKKAASASTVLHVHGREAKDRHRQSGSTLQADTKVGMFRGAQLSIEARLHAMSPRSTSLNIPQACLLLLQVKLLQLRGLQAMSCLGQLRCWGHVCMASKVVTAPSCFVQLHNAMRGLSQGCRRMGTKLLLQHLQLHLTLMNWTGLDHLRFPTLQRTGCMPPK